MASSFRITTWDPILIISQIASIQSIYYIILSIWLWITLSLAGMPMTLDAIFQATALQTDNVFGWTLCLVIVVNAAAMVPVLVLVVQRARQVLDFVLTLHGFHLLSCWCRNHRFPMTLSWWLVQLVAIVVMTLGGEWACMRYEMKPILLGKSNTKNDSDAGADHGNRITNKNGSDNGIIVDEAPEEGLHHSDEDELVISSSSNQMAHTKKAKRKASDAENDRQLEQLNHEGPLTTVVGKAKQVLLDKSQRWISTSSKTTNDYEIIPLNNVANR